jgi:flagella basal body P-ring formation protein FlgA
MSRRFLPAALAAALALIAVQGARAGQPVTLNANITDAGGQVTLGELFDDAGPARDVVVAPRNGPSVVLDAAAVQVMARRYGLDWDNPAGLRRIIVRAASSEAQGNVEVLTYARNLVTGDVVQPQDLIWAKAAAAPSGAPHDADSLIGMAARRPLRQGDPVLGRDVSPPIVIKAGDEVQVTYADGGIVLTLQAKATANAAVGESVNILNTASKKMIEAVASGPDQAVVGPDAARLKAEHAATQFALR